MKEAGRIVLIIALIVGLLGFICVGVGLMTGADTMRVYNTLDERYNISGYYEAYSQYAGDVAEAVTEAWQTPAA